MTAREWTKREDAFLYKNYPKLSTEEVAEALKRTIKDVEERIKETFNGGENNMVITQGRKGRKWTEQEDRFVLENHDELTAGEMARILKRTVAAVNSRRFKLSQEEGAKNKTVEKQLKKGGNTTGKTEKREKGKNDVNGDGCELLNTVMSIYGGRIKADISRKISAEAQKRNFLNVRALSELAIELDKWKGVGKNEESK